MKVVHICLSGAVTDGFAYQDNLLSKYHKKLGMDVTFIATRWVYNEKGEIVTTDKSDYVNDDGVHMIRLENKPGETYTQKFKHLSGLYEALVKEEPDRIFVHGVQFLEAPEVVKYMKENKDVKLYVDNHADYSNSGRNFLSKYILQKGLWRHMAQILNPYTEKFFGVLPARVDWLIDTYSLPKEKCELLVMGADDELVEKYMDCGMLLVMLGHQLPETSYLRNFIYSFHMPLFFILSGFVLKRDDKNKSLVELIKSEKKMIVVYLFWSAVYFAIDLIVKFGLLKTLTLRGVIERVIYIFSSYGINVLWFIGSLIVGRILARALLSLVDNIKIRWIVTVAFVVVPAVLSTFLDVINSWFVSVILIVILRGAFVSGLLLLGYLIKDKMTAMMRGGYSILGVLLLLVNVVVANFMGAVDLHHMDFGIWPLFLVSMLTGTFGFICFCRQLEKLEPVRNGLVFLGVNSLFIMVTHNYLYINDGITYITKCLVDNVVLEIVVSFVLLLAVEIVLCYFVAPIYNRFIG